ncbi:hypothetical protein [Burkholderia ubonensis]|uniref:hypothetical protein n=1 Tax=Burkholderia ubonensis TaxID=101571 RepID=UPI00142D63BC|nr:hypothetical protein [Burkholderia ubonensis]
MKVKKRLAVFSITALVSPEVQAQQAPTLAGQAAVARANAEQDRQAQQQLARVM